PSAAPPTLPSFPTRRSSDLVLDLIVEAGADYRIEEFQLGKTNIDPSSTRIEVSANDEAALDSLLELLQVHGVNRTTHGDATLVQDRKSTRLNSSHSQISYAV